MQGDDATALLKDELFVLGSTHRKGLQCKQVKVRQTATMAVHMKAYASMRMLMYTYEH